MAVATRKRKTLLERYILPDWTGTPEGQYEHAMQLQAQRQGLKGGGPTPRPNFAAMIRAPRRTGALPAVSPPETYPYGTFEPGADLAGQIVRPSSRGPMPVGPAIPGTSPRNQPGWIWANQISRPSASAFSAPANLPQQTTGVSPWQSYMLREARAPQVPSPEAEATAARIMQQERAKWAAQVRAPRLSGTATGPIGLYPTYGEPLGFRGGLEDLPVFDPVRARRPSYTLGRDLETWRRMSAPEPEPPPEMPEERMARIEAAFAGGELATQRGRAGPGEDSALSKYLRAVVAGQAGAGPMPPPFRGASVDQEIAGLKQGLARPEGTVKITPEERQAKRQREMDTRSLMREQKRIGQPITRQRAEMLATIRGKMERGEPLRPEQIGILFGPEAEAQAHQFAPEVLETYKEIARQGAWADILKGYAATGKEPPTWLRDGMLGRGRAAGGGGVAPGGAGGGGGLAPGGAPPEKPGFVIDPDIASVDEIAQTFLPAVREDPERAIKALRGRGVDINSIRKWAIQTYGPKALSERGLNFWEKKMPGRTTSEPIPTPRMPEGYGMYM